MSILKFIGKMQDSVAISVLGGLIGAIPMDISNYLLWKNGKTENLYGHVAASMLMSKFRTNQTKNFLLGQFWHYAACAGFGFPAFYLLKKTGKDHLLLKGVSVGIFTWGLLYNAGMKIGLYNATSRLTKTKYAALWHNFLYGVTTVYTIAKVSDPNLFPDKQITPGSSYQNKLVNDTL
jgi:hypothetical protein